MQAQTCDSGTELFGFAASFLPKHILFPLVGLHPAAARHFSRLAKKKKKKNSCVAGSQGAGGSSLVVGTESLSGDQRSVNSLSIHLMQTNMHEY